MRLRFAGLVVALELDGGVPDAVAERFAAYRIDAALARSDGDEPGVAPARPGEGDGERTPSRAGDGVDDPRGSATARPGPPVTRGIAPSSPSTSAASAASAAPAAAPPDLVVSGVTDAALAVDVDDRRYPEAIALHDGARYRFLRRDLDAAFDLTATPARLVVRARPTPAVETALRLAVALLLPRRGGLLLHSSGVVDGGRGFVFSGRSGAGKTTTVRLLAPRRPLGDDLVALLPDAVGAGFHASSTPFAGDFGVVPPASAPLARLFFLEQASALEVTPLDEAAARVAILRNTLAYVRDPDTAGRLQDVAARLARHVRCARLRFPRDPIVARALDDDA